MDRIGRGIIDVDRRDGVKRAGGICKESVWARQKNWK